MKKARKRSISLNQKGFSLVEVLMAVVILGLIAAPVCQMLMQSYRINYKSKRMLIASDVSQMVMEGITAQSYEDTSTNNGTVIKGLKNYYATWSVNSVMPMYPNKVAPTNGSVMICGTLTQAYLTSSVCDTYYFRDVKYMEYDAATGFWVDSKAQNNEKPFDMVIEFWRQGTGDFYPVEVHVIIYDYDEKSGEHVKHENEGAKSTERYQDFVSAVVNKFRDDR